MLTGKQIEHYYKNSFIHISDFNEEHVGPNSYDVRLSDELLMYTPNEFGVISLDCKKENATMTLRIPEEGFVLKPGVLYLGSTMEEIGSDYFVPMYEGRSSLARLGIQSHISAGFGDIGFKSKWTLEIVVPHPVRIYAGMRIGQVFFHQIFTEEFGLDVLFKDAKSIKYTQSVKMMEKKGLVSLYKGKYTQQQRPQSSKLFEDFGGKQGKKNYESLFLDNLDTFISTFEAGHATTEGWYTIYRIMVNETDDKAIIVLGSTSPDEYECEDIMDEPTRKEEPTIYASFCCMSYDARDYFLDEDSDLQGGFESTDLYLMKRGNDAGWKRIYSREGYDLYLRDGWGEIKSIK